MKKTFFIFLCSLIGITEARSQSLAERSPVVALRLTTNARAAGIGNATLATEYDGTDISNTAKLPWAMDNIQGLEIARNTYSVSGKQFNTALLYSFTYAHADEAGHDFSFGVKYFDGGDILNALSHGNDYRDLIIEAGYAKKITPRMALALISKVLNSRIDLNGSTDALAFDLVWYYRATNQWGKGYSAGAALSNIGTTIDYGVGAGKFLPATVAIAGAYTWVNDRTDNKCMVTMEINKSLAPAFPDSLADQKRYESQNTLEALFINTTKGFTASVGIEYTFKLSPYPYSTDAISIRTGGVLDNFAEEFSGVTTGIGIVFKKVHIDVAYFITPKVPTSPVGNKVTASLSFGF